MQYAAQHRTRHTPFEVYSRWLAKLEANTDIIQ